MEPIYKNNKIIYCYYSCEEGEGGKCLSCDKNENKCKSCNNGYTLFNGQCLNYTFKAIYHTNSDYETIKLINSDQIIKLKIYDILVDSLNKYTFPSKGDQLVYLSINSTKLSQGYFLK